MIAPVQLEILTGLMGYYSKVTGWTANIFYKATPEYVETHKERAQEVFDELLPDFRGGYVERSLRDLGYSTTDLKAMTRETIIDLIRKHKIPPLPVAEKL